MEYRVRLKFRLVILSLVSLSCACIKCEIYYVKPTSPQDVDCPGTPCQTLNDYGKLELPKSPDGNKSDTVTMILIEGYHRASTNYYNFGSPIDSYALHVIGKGQSSNTVKVFKLETAITVMNMILENVTALKAYIYIDETVVDFQITNISISNCAFVESALILTNVHLTIKDSNFSKSTSTAIMLFSSTVTFVGRVMFHRNNGIQGGALMLIGALMKIAREAEVYFQENYAENTGGAIFVIHPQMMINAHDYYSSCFYQLLDYDSDSTYSIQFVNNSAAKGGDHIYGASLNSGCYLPNDLDSYEMLHRFFWFDPGYNSTFSAVSADATRVCICVNGQPQCDTILVYLEAYPGEQFQLSVVVVGGDYGTTTGTVYASFYPQTSTSVLGSYQQHQLITKNTECSTFNFSVYSNESHDTLCLTAQEVRIKSVKDYYDYLYTHINQFSDNDYDYGYDVYDENYEYSSVSRNKPLFIYVNLFPCPPGFILFGDPPGCHCHPVLTDNGIDCHLNEYHNWNLTNIWIQAVDSTEHTTILFSTHCPFEYCKPSGKHINLNSPDTQCAFDRAGLLCGSCKDNYSLAIGSSHCIHCPNNNNLALLIFFAIAGVFLVLIIAALNLTVTQGKINSLVFYANIIWAYQNILFPPSFGRELIVHKTFIAWLNLDFGIESCFFSGMNAYTKTWLQFVFPFYTAGLFFLGLRYSSKLAKLVGSRSVPTLATLLLLSCSKLLRTIITCLQLAIYYTYNDSSMDGSVNIVWAVDGNFFYGRYPHIFLLLAAILCFILLWMPYTLLLFSMQWLRSVDHHGPLKFIARYKPIYDAYFAPLKDKHHYWFGIPLLVQGVLLLVSSLTLNTFPEISVLLLLAISIFLLCYVIGVRPYKSMSVAILESSFMINFNILAVGYLYFRYSDKGKMILLSLSITAALVEFCGIVIWNLTPKKLIKWLQIKAKINTHDQLELEDVHILEEHHTDSEYASYCDSQRTRRRNGGQQSHVIIE